MQYISVSGLSTYQLLSLPSGLHFSSLETGGAWSLPVVQYISVSGLSTYQLLILPSGLRFARFPRKFWTRRITMRAACPVHPTVLDFVTAIMFDEKQIFWSSPIMYLSTHLSKFVLFLVPNTPSVFSNTLILSFFQS